MRLDVKNYDGPHEEVAGWPQVEVTLSRRNLLALLHKVDMPGSARRIESRDSTVMGRAAEVVLVVRCEGDEEHYDGPRRRARGKRGRMHRYTEAFVQEHHVREEADRREQGQGREC